MLTGTHRIPQRHLNEPAGQILTFRNKDIAPVVENDYLQVHKAFYSTLVVHVGGCFYYMCCCFIFPPAEPLAEWVAHLLYVWSKEMKGTLIWIILRFPHFIEDILKNVGCSVIKV